MLRRKWIRVWPVGLFALPQGCGCNPVGCFNGLTVTLNSDSTHYLLRVKARSPGSPAVYVSECQQDVMCGGASLGDFRPARVVLTSTPLRDTL